MNEDPSLDLLERLVSNTSGLKEVINEFDDDLTNIGEDLGLQCVTNSATDYFVFLAALNSCSLKGRDVLCDQDLFSQFHLANVMLSCLQTETGNDDLTCILSSSSRSNLKKVLGQVKEEMKRRPLSINFGKIISSCSPCPLELICHLHNEGLMMLEEYIKQNMSSPQVITDLNRGLVACCQNCENNEAALFTFSVLLRFLIRAAYSKSNKEDASSKSVQKMSHKIVHSLILKILKFNEENQHFNGGNLVAPLVEDFLEYSSVHVFCLETLSTILIFNPVIKVTQAVAEQNEWSYKSCSPWLQGLYMKLMIILKPEEVTDLLGRILEGQEVNWFNILTTVSALVTLHQTGANLMKDLIEQLLKKAFDILSVECLLSAFLLARHAAQEAPHYFPSYISWFENYFGHADTTYANNTRLFAFLMKFLTDLVPFEQARYLKNHLQKPPHVVGKCRQAFSDYASLVRTRLHDLNVPLQQNAIYASSEDGQSTSELSQESSVQKDVKKALELYETSGKIPPSILEASIFRKPYFLGQFLPALLMPRILPEQPDTMCRFMEDLKKLGKIKASQYEKYVNECNNVQKESQDVILLEENTILSAAELLRTLMELLKRVKNTLSESKDPSSLIMKIIDTVQRLGSLDQSPVPSPIVQLKFDPAHSELPVFPVCESLLELLAVPNNSYEQVLLSSFLSCHTFFAPVVQFVWKILFCTTENFEEHVSGCCKIILQIGSKMTNPGGSFSCNSKRFQSLPEAVFSELGVFSHLERTRTLRISCAYLNAVVSNGSFKDKDPIPFGVPLILFKKLQFCMKKNEHISPGMLGIEATMADDIMSIPMVKNWIESVKLTISEWVTMEANVSDINNSRLSYLSFIKEKQDIQELLNTLLKLLIEGELSPGARNHLETLLQNILMTSPSSILPGGSVPWLLNEFNKLLETTENSLDHYYKVEKFFRLYLFLPPYKLLIDSAAQNPGPAAVSSFVNTVNKHMVSVTNCDFICDLTVHIWKCLQQGNLTQFQISTILKESPLLMYCFVLHWRNLAPVLLFEPVKCEILLKLIQTVNDLYNNASEFCSNHSFEAGRKLEKFSDAWIAGLVLAVTLSHLKMVPSHFTKLHLKLQHIAMLFLCLCTTPEVTFKTQQGYKSTSENLTLKLLAMDPKLCTSVNPSIFEKSFFNKLLTSYTGYLCIIAFLRILLNHLENENQSICCFISTIKLIESLQSMEESLSSESQQVDFWAVIDLKKKAACLLQGLGTPVKQQLFAACKDAILKCPPEIQILFQEVRH